MRVAVYAAAALLGLALFIFLHHLGNRIDYRAAAQRYAADFETDRPDEGFTAGFKTPFDYCKLSAIVMAGAQTGEPGGNNALRDAVLLRELAPTSQHYDFCDELRAAVDGAMLHEQYTSPHYWHGSKAIFAILLRSLAIEDIRALIRFGAYAGWAALAIALLWLAPRALVVVAPLIFLGCFFSGIRYFAVPYGIPYLWAVWAAVTLVVLLRVRLAPARLFCFIAGMVLCYLYQSAGPSILMVVLIGLLAYFGHDRWGEAARGARLAGGCVALYAAGLAAAFTLGQAAKMALEACLVPDWFGWRAVCEGVPTDQFVWRSLSSKVIYHLIRGVLEASVSLRAALQDVPLLARAAELLPAPGQGLENLVAPRLRISLESWAGRGELPIVQHFERYWQVGLGSAAAGRILTWAAGGSLAAAAAAAVVQAWRRRPAALGRVAWMAVLMALAGLLFLVPNDEPYRVARYLFVLYALALGALAAVAMETAAPERAVDANDASVP